MIDNKGTWTLVAALTELINSIEPGRLRIVADWLHVLCDPRRQLMDSWEAQQLWDRLRGKEAAAAMHAKRDPRDFDAELDDDAGETQAREHWDMEEAVKRAELWDYD